MSVRPLERSELPRAAATLALAFEDDPLFRFLLPDADTRPKWLRWITQHALTESHSVGGALTVEGGPELGVVALTPPGTWPISLAAQARAFTWPPGVPSARLLRVGLAIESAILKLHPPGPHLYVYVLGVHPAQKGRGLGGTLLRHAAALAREAGVVAHLETSNPVNLPLYRKFGYEVGHELSLHGAPPVWTMTTPGPPPG